MQTDAERARVDLVEYIARLAKARGAGPSPFPVAGLVFRPGGVPGGNVYTTWPTLYTAITLMQGPKTVAVDSHLAAANVPAGTYALDEVTFEPGTSQANTPLLTFLDGAHVTGGGIIIRRGLTVANTGATAVVSVPGAGFFWLELDDFANLLSGAGAPFIALAAGATILTTASRNSTLGDGTHAVIGVNAGATQALGYLYNGSTLAANAIAGAGAAVAKFNFDDTSSASTTQAAGTVLNASSNAPGTPGYNPQWYAKTDVYWDPVAGVDTNTGDVGSPLLTFAEIVRRYGSTAPVLVYGQNLTIHQLTSQPAGQDPVFFEPHISGGGHAALIGTPVLVADIPVGGAVTAKVRGAPGVRLQVAAMPAGTVAGQLVLNVTRASYAFIDSMAVLVATMQQPCTTASLTTIGLPAGVIDDTWATGDHLQTYTLPSVNLKRWTPVCADVAPGGASVGWVQMVAIADVSGAGTAAYIFQCKSAANVLSLVSTAERIHFGSEGGRGQQSVALSCNCTAGGGVAFMTNASQWFAGGAVGGLLVLANISGSCVDGDATLHNGQTILGSCKFGNVFMDGTISVSGGTFEAGGFVWGSYAPTVNPGCKWWNVTGSTFVLKALLTSGAIHLGTAATGSSYSGGGVFVDGVALTPAAIDAGGVGGPGLCNPVTGAAYCNAA